MNKKDRIYLKLKELLKSNPYNQEIIVDISNEIKDSIILDSNKIKNKVLSSISEKDGISPLFEGKVFISNFNVGCKKIVSKEILNDEVRRYVKEQIALEIIYFLQKEYE